jgi:transcriptional regulator with XRE-family HTH domain
MATAIKRPRARAKAHKPPRDRTGSGANVQALRQRYGLSQALLARLLGVSVRTVSGLESGAAVQAQAGRNVTQARRLCEALGEAMEAGYVGRWLDEPNEMLGGLKPVEAIERGQIDLVWQVVEGLRAGSPL